jgi:hypothetical protein
LVDQVGEEHFAAIRFEEVKDPMLNFGQWLLVRSSGFSRLMIVPLMGGTQNAHRLAAFGPDPFTVDAGGERCLEHLAPE